ncbi:MAG: excinuclease ABC subunit UvrC [Terasakiella sp.]|uniref:excinuclease ABC subunit UvrC n=1 Tax=unclassified Terasakiella TaxID=2614952 RepID=UPI003B00BA2C
MDVIKNYLKTLDAQPGVYRMLNEKGDVLYVGKAKSLKKRVANYTTPQRLTIRIQRMISQTYAMEFITTHTEAEALLLESNLIKKLKPRYNILLRDDKSFPMILVTGDHDYPQVLKHRGAKNRKGRYFGPFASAWAVNETLNTLQRAFLLRPCSNSIFASRTRPCLQFQIKRCSAPCVGRISVREYGKLVEQSERFLRGDSKALQNELAQRMAEASENLEFEEAAIYRDRISAMTRIQQRQDINIQGLEEADVIAGFLDGGQTCVQVFFFRAGANFGNRAYYPAHGSKEELPDILEAFIGQFYADKQPPKQILVSHDLPGHAILEEALCVRAERKVSLQCPKRGEKTKLIAHAMNNAREALGRRLAQSASQRRLLQETQRIMQMDNMPERIEVYDNSHIQGTNSVGAMIAAGPDGFIKNAYRKFNIKTAQSDDDYAMMREVLTRRFSRAIKEDPDKEKGQWPNLVIIDGGKGQLGVAVSVFEELGIDDVTLAGISKGPERNAGYDKIVIPGQEPFQLEHTDPVNHFIQRLRDEAHRFAIGTHRAKRGKATTKSVLDSISGIGAKRKKALLHHFGSAKGVAQAGLSDLEAVDGINKTTAKLIYDHFHEN